MSNFDEEYDSDTEYVPDYDMIDLNDFQLNKGTELVGGSWGAVIEHLREDDISFQFAMPPFRIGDSVDISEASKNGFIRFKLDLEDEKHSEFLSWISGVESWLVEQFVSNHNKWFGHMWQSGGPLEGRPLPPSDAIKEMYHPLVDEENVFCTRVHIRKGKYDIQCMDSDQNIIDFNDISNCIVVPLVELKGIFMKPRGYNPDIVIRGLVIVNEEKTDDNEGSNEYCLFHTQNGGEEYQYMDYATDDDTASESDDTELINNQAEFANNEEQEEDEDDNGETLEEEDSIIQNNSQLDEEKIKELMRATENAKLAAKDAEEIYKKYISQANSN